MAGAGFRLVLNYDVLSASAAQVVAYAKYAAGLGLKIAWAVENPGWWALKSASELSTYPALASTCRCSDNAGLLAYVVSLVKGNAATWGYYIADEPSADEHDAVKAYGREVSSLDGNHPTMVVSSEDCGTLGAGIEPFIDAADVVAADYYPVGTPCPISAWTSIAANVEAHARAHQKAGTVMVAQAACLCEYPDESTACSPFPSCATYPTETEMADELQAITRGATPLVVMWYSYFINGSGAAISGQHWLDLVTAAIGHPPAAA